MKLLTLIPVVVCLCMAAFAINELGDLNAARKNHPAIFVPGNVLEYSVGGELGYVFNGEAERCFDGEMAENDSELYQEAVLDAKASLLKFLKKDSDTDSVRLSGVTKLYEYPDGEMRRVVLYVAKKNVFRSAQQSGCSPQGGMAKSGDAGGVEGGRIEAETTARKPVETVDSSATSKTNVNETMMLPEVSGTVDESGSATANTNRIAMYLKQIEDNPNDCIAMSKAAKLYARQGDLGKAKGLYAKIVNCVIADEKMDKWFASGLMMEAARFEKGTGDVNLALKYYRLFVRCDGLRRWKLHELVSEANKNISDLLLLEL